MLYYGIKIPYYVEAKDVLASAFMVWGFAYKRIGFHFEERVWVAVIMGVFIVSLGVNFWPCSMNTLTWQKVVPYFISALFGTFMVFAICKWLCKNVTMTKILTYVGDRTLDILIWHFLSFKFISFIIIIIYELSIARLAEFPVIVDYAHNGWWPLYMIFGVFFSLIMENLLKRGNKAFKQIYVTFWEK